MQDLRKVKCPKCGRKGLHYADHTHAFGWKDYSRIECRFCKRRFRFKDKLKDAENIKPAD